MRAERAGRRRRTGTWLAYGAGLALLAGLVLRVGPSDFIAALGAAQGGLVALSVATYALVLASGAGRWAYLARCTQPGAPLRGAGSAYLTNAFLSNLTPGRSGDALAPWLLRERCGLSLSRAGALVVVDRAADLLVLGGAGATAAILFGLERTRGLAEGGGPSRVLLLGALALAGAGGAALLALSRTGRGARALDGLWEGLRALCSRRRLAVLLPLAAVTWALHLAKEYALVSAFLPIGLREHFICQTAATLAGLLSFVPAGVGVGAVGYSLVAYELGVDWRAAASAQVLGTLLSNGLRFALASLTLASSASSGPRRRSGSAQPDAATPGSGAC